MLAEILILLSVALNLMEEKKTNSLPFAFTFHKNSSLLIAGLIGQVKFDSKNILPTPLVPILYLEIKFKSCDLKTSKASCRSD